MATRELKISYMACIIFVLVNEATESQTSPLPSTWGFGKLLNTNLIIDNGYICIILFLTLKHAPICSSPMEFIIKHIVNLSGYRFNVLNTDQLSEDALPSISHHIPIISLGGGGGWGEGCK